MNEREFNQRVIYMVPAASPLQTTPVWTEAELRAKRQVLAMAYHQIDSAKKIVNRLRAELGELPDEDCQ